MRLVQADSLEFVPESQACDPCDMNCDGIVNAFDIDPFIALLFDPNAVPCSAYAGDANGDGNVDFADFLILAANFGTGLSWSEGNFEGSEDGTQFADFLVLSVNFGHREGE